ncbi:MAG: 50S ribosomal protein L29 [Actinomycetota bacterium]|nr:50S ribosomal protein L29 [Actinomycetota bacterium]
MTKAAELRELSPNDLATRLEETRRELFNLRFQLATGRLENPSRIGVLRREVARLRTLETERTLDAEGGPNGAGRRTRRKA